VPHAGRRVPPWLASRCRLTPGEIEADGDEGAGEVYALRDQVAAFVTTDVARAVVDMNRPEADRGKDGVVKTHTCWDLPIWSFPLTAAEVERLLDEHHRPYHAQLTRLAGPDVVLGVDCHTMAAVAPPVAPDPGVSRPAACLSNAQGTCPRDWIERLADLLAAELGREVAINHPFQGGHITRTHAAEMPWLQIELSRQPFLDAPGKRRAVLSALAALVARAGG
jgi:N-formylglutamate amidohydrolase